MPNDEDQLMLRPVKMTQAWRALIPDTEVFQLKTDHEI
jgi:hypothetical protein